MKIDTSTTAGKIEVMQAHEDSKGVQFFNEYDEEWRDLDKTGIWNWEIYKYRVKPQTVEDAADKASRKYLCETNAEAYSLTKGFLEGSQWQKEQDNER